ncbi:uncharacterized protein LW93_1552 [Fusarium fujikuroi]|nr:uncharacterized protein LW93_1552 [Fusarium fujikuroi]SCV25310.1 uncharacterized protein FFB14_00203 [Fusarium fujikuroi]
MGGEQVLKIFIILRRQLIFDSQETLEIKGQLLAGLKTPLEAIMVRGAQTKVLLECLAIMPLMAFTANHRLEDRARLVWVTEYDAIDIEVQSSMGSKKARPWGSVRK